MSIKYILINTFILGFFQLIFAQNKTDDKGLKQGKWSEKDAQGNIKYEGTFKDNKPTGKFVFYYADKKVKSEVNYAPNGLDADVLVFYESGKKKAQGKYLNQKKHLTWQYFNADGELASQESYKNGLKEGVSKIFFPSGKLAEVDSFKQDLRYGQSVKYYSTGLKRVECSYIDDEAEGRYIEYYEDGKFKAIGKYLDGLKTGTWEYFFEDGTSHFKEIYDKGNRLEMTKLNGEFEEYYPGEVEILKERVTYKNGKKNGPFSEYYELGEWKFKTVSPNQDQFPGGQDEVYRYFDGQKLKREGQYVNDVLDGKVYNYNENGNKTTIDVYQNGIKTGEVNE